MVEKLGRADLASDARFDSPASRLANRSELSTLLDAIFIEKPTTHWLTLFEGHIPVAPVNQLDQALDNPWLNTIGMTDTVSHPDREEFHVLASPIKIDGKRLPNRAGPLLGQDSDDILSELGFDADGVAELRQAGVV